MKRTTKQKQILQQELTKQKTFFSAEEFHQKVKNKHVGIATVYRFLNEKEQEGTLHSYLCNRRKIYSSQNNSHCHFICENTGETIHFTIGNLDFLKDKLPGKITSFQLEVKGICGECKK